MTWYALASFRQAGSVRVALVFDGRLYDLAHAAKTAGTSAEWTTSSVDELITRWEVTAPALNTLAMEAAGILNQLEAVSIDSDDIAPPFRPSRFFCAAANYSEHAREMGTRLGAKEDRKPYFFMKPDTSLIGHNDTILIPPQSSQVDWEIELAAVIGRETRYVTAEDALDCVAGYTVINDVSARDLNVRDDYPFKMDWFQGKCFDTFAPLGPWLVPSICICRGAYS